MEKLFLSAVLILGFFANLLRADPAADRLLENTAAASFAFRTFFDDKIAIKVVDGVATLTGVVRDPLEKTLAADAMAAFAGITQVENKIVVRPSGAPAGDAWIALQIERRLLVRKGVSAANTRVDVVRGAVLLSGTAGNAEQKELTEALAREVPGVKTITNGIVVNHPPGNTPGFGERLDDASITALVKYALRKIPALAEAAIQVESLGGVVTLAGPVPNVDVQADAEKVALSIRGVRSVKSQLAVGG